MNASLTDQKLKKNIQRFNKKFKKNILEAVKARVKVTLYSNTAYYLALEQSEMINFC